MENNASFDNLITLELNQGAAGPPGEAATIQITTTTTLEPGMPATITEDAGSTPQARKYTVGLPAGDRGPQGEAGSVAIGEVTTGAPGTPATVVNVGTSQNAILNITIPAGEPGKDGEPGTIGPPGEKGNPGEKGDPGRAATIKIGTVTTGGSGQAAAAINVGTENDAIIDLTIPMGPKGDQGDQGERGETATIKVGTVTTSEPGSNASFVNVGTENAAIFDVVLPRGTQGPAGTDGKTPTITVGTVTTGEPGTPATVTNSGTATDPVFDFGIPKGEQGIQGEPGKDGADGAAATIAVGTTTTGAAGTNASVTNSGTANAAILNFTIPAGKDGTDGQDGAQGPPGANGADGAAATIAVGTTSTLVPGSQATVTNSGNANAAVFNFGIPQGAQGVKGDKGDKGDAGATGPQGPQGPKGDTGATGATGPQGPAGANGVSVTHSWSGTTLTVTSASGTSSANLIGPQGPQGIQGPQGTPGANGSPGATGPAGPAGAAATIAVGTTTTLPSGSAATVTNVGTANAAVFNFGIPKGESGSGGGGSFTELYADPVGAVEVSGRVYLQDTGSSDNVLFLIIGLSVLSAAAIPARANILIITNPNNTYDFARYVGRYYAAMESASAAGNIKMTWIDLVESSGGATGPGLLLTLPTDQFPSGAELKIQLTLLGN